LSLLKDNEAPGTDNMGFSFTKTIGHTMFYR